MSSQAVAIVTGAAGGMGRACARTFGRTQTLVLMDINEAGLKAFAAGLEEEGYTVAAAIAGDLAEQSVVDEVVGKAREAGRLRTVMHTAGLSPALAPWDAILRTNVSATERLLRAVEEKLEPGLAAVLIASMAGIMAQAVPEIDAVMDASLADDFLQRAGPLLEQHTNPANPAGRAGTAYSHSKRTVMRICELRARSWGRKDARIMSISPGMISTPMGRAEQRATELSARLAAAAPMGRQGTPLDIAAAAAFLASDAAGFVTGCDLLVDGGLTAGPGARRLRLD